MPPIFKYLSAIPLQDKSPARLQVALKEAISVHQKGQLPLAQSMYEAILKIQPKYYQALHLLGLVAAQRGNFQDAVDLISRAIEIFPGNADFHVNKGNALKSLRQLDSAIASYDEALAIKPDHAQAYCNRGVALQTLGRLDAAVECYQRAISIRPDYAEAYSNCGLALQKLRRLDESLACYERAVAVSPSYAEFHFFRGNVLMELQNVAAAVGSYDNAIALRPTHAQAHFNRGFGLQVLKHYDAALASYDKAIGCYAEYAEAHCNRGVVLIELKQLDLAVISCDRAIALKPDYAEAHFNRGNALLYCNQYDGALSSYDRALSINPAYAKAFANRGFTLLQLGQLNAALVSYNKAIEINPHFAEAHCNRGLVLHELKLMDDALVSYERAIATDPDYASAYFNKSLTYLVCGSFELGWVLYEWRLKTEDSKLVPRIFAQPFWLGEDSLVGKTILLHSEQGYGDTIQFCRYATMAASLGGRVILEVPESLLGVLGGLDGDIELVARGTPLPVFDYHCPLLSLPFAFKTDAASIPASQSYLRGEPDRAGVWAKRLGSKTKSRVGLVWSGNAAHVNDHNRSIELAALLDVLPDSLEFVSLQKEVRISDRVALESYDNIRYFGDALIDFGDTAALCELMDFVVSVDTSVAHLSGALGRPTWVLLPYVPDWRWQLDRDDSPWYPSVKLFRQSSDRGWDGVLTQLRAELQNIPFLEI